MNNPVRLIPSGYQFVDKSWGGIYQGGSYLLMGPRKSGRTLMGLQFAMEAAKTNHTCLFFTNMRPKDLMIQAASLNFDIQSYMDDNLIIVVRVAPPSDVYNQPNSDYLLVDYLRDIVTVVEQYQPNRIVFDELTPYIGFRNPNILRDAFLDTLEYIEEHDITSLFIVGEPATQKAETLIDSVSQFVTALIQLKKSATKFHERFHGGTVTITPNVGHTEGQFTYQYQIEPFKGVTVPENKDKPELKEKKAEAKIPRSIDRVQDSNQSDITNNAYTYNDFMLILNNQIALYKSTGQIFNLVSFKLDPGVQARGILSLRELQNALQLSIERKDKICYHDNLIMVLIVRSTTDSVANLVTRMEENLPLSDNQNKSAIRNSILMVNIEANQDIKDAQSLAKSLSNSDPLAQDLYVPIKNMES